jgi:transcriptional regulator with XRE-family HTH domain
MNAKDNLRAARLRVGKTVRQLRKQRGWTQEQLAERVGNNPRHVGQIERGEVNVGIDKLTRIASSLSVDLADLFPPNSPDHAVTLDRRDFNQLHEQLHEAFLLLERLKRGERG